jgi:hypothetical protein
MKLRKLAYPQAMSCLTAGFPILPRDALIASLQEILKLSNEQTAVLMSDFVSRLPKYLQNALHLASMAA